MCLCQPIMSKMANLWTKNKFCELLLAEDPHNHISILQAQILIWPMKSKLFNPGIEIQPWRTVIWRTSIDSRSIGEKCLLWPLISMGVVVSQSTAILSREKNILLSDNFCLYALHTGFSFTKIREILSHCLCFPLNTHLLHNGEKEIF